MISPSINWLIFASLMHSLWQGLLLAWLASRIARATRTISVHHRFGASFAVLLLISLTPIINYMWLSNQSTPPQAVAIATHRYQENELSLWTIAELAEESKTNASEQNEKSTSKATTVADKSTDSNNSNQLSSAVPTIADANTGLSFRVNWLVVGTTLFSTLYLIGASVMLARLALGMRQHSSLIRACGKADLDSSLHQSTLESAERAASSLGKKLGSKIMLYQGRGAAMVVGLLRPMVLVNAALVSGLSPKQLEHIIAHELAHIYRWDPLTQWIQRLIESVLFLHPAVWLVSRQVSTLREMCCDEWVAEGGSRVEYAQTLLECVAISSVQKPPTINIDAASKLDSFSLAATGSGAKQLAYRIEALLQPSPMSDHERHSENRALKWGIVLLTLVTSGTMAYSIATQVWRTATAPTSNTFFAQQTNEGSLAVLGSGPLSLQEVDDQEPTVVTDPDWTWQPIPNTELKSTQFLFNGQKLLLADSIPEDVEVNLMADDGQLRFGQWHFGDSAARRIALVAMIEGGEISRLFIDKNRDRSIDMEEEIDTKVNDGKSWVVDLNVEIREKGKLLQAKRTIGITTKQSKLELRINSIGFVGGTTTVDGKSVAVRRYDVDGNGIATDYRDRTWIDLDQDGQFDPLTERHALRNTLVLDGKQYSVRSDRLGHSLTLDSNAEQGSILFQFAAKDTTATIESVEGSLRDESGFVLAVRADGKPVTMPAGKYCIESLVVRVRDKKDTLWTLTLARGFEHGWFDIRADEQKEVRLLESLKLHATSFHEPSRISMTNTWVQPSLYTPNGLVVTNLVNNSATQTRGFDTGSVVTNFQLISPSGGGSTKPTAACSGFN